MSRNLLLAPHNDDETLFASWLILQWAPRVVVVFKSAKQEAVGITSQTRENETHDAMTIFGVPWEQWPILDTIGDLQGRIAIRSLMETMRPYYDMVFAPAIEDGGHVQHNIVGEVALEVFGPDRVTQYLTYRRGYGRTRGNEVEFAPHWPALKLRALACYKSQIAEPSTSYWFLDDTLREYVP